MRRDDFAYIAAILLIITLIGILAYAYQRSHEGAGVSGRGHRYVQYECSGPGIPVVSESFGPGAVVSPYATERE